MVTLALTSTASAVEVSPPPAAPVPEQAAALRAAAWQIGYGVLTIGTLADTPLSSILWGGSGPIADCLS